MVDSLAQERRINILLTGATGFVGSHLLSNLIRSPDVNTIYTICRNSNFSTNNIVSDALIRFELDHNDENKKIRIIRGDISLPGLGLYAQENEELCSEVDVIFHVAAQVNHILPYQALKPANVDSTAYLLKIALTGKPKIVNLISTLGSATYRNQEGIFLEQFPKEANLDSDMGYLISKWASEKLIAKFHSAGYSGNIIRLGYITGHSQSGISLCYDNQLMLLIKSCIQIGYAPRLSRLINMTPVDLTAKIMNAPEFRNEGGRVVNIVNTREYISWNDLIEWFIDQGYQISLIDFNEWQNKIYDIDENNALFRFLPLFTCEDAQNKVMRFAKNILQYETSESNRLLKKYSIEMPSIKETLLRKYYKYLLRVGFISIPVFNEN